REDGVLFTAAILSNVPGECKAKSRPKGSAPGCVQEWGRQRLRPRFFVKSTEFYGDAPSAPLPADFLERTLALLVVRIAQTATTAIEPENTRRSTLRRTGAVRSRSA